MYYLLKFIIFCIEKQNIRKILENGKKKYSEKSENCLVRESGDHRETK